MAKRRTHEIAPRTKTVTIRLTHDEYLRRSIDARKAGLSVSGLCERLITQGRVEPAATMGHRPMHPALLEELRRIGNNANQIAHALNGNLPADVQMSWRTARDLLRFIARHELLMQRTMSERHHPAAGENAAAFVSQIAEALSTREAANDPPAPQARDVFQRSVQVHPARRGQGHD